MQETHGMRATINPPTHLCVQPDELPVHLPPETIERRLADLVRAYVHGRSSALALSVVRHCEALLLHPALSNQPDRLEGLCRLARHWRLLSVQVAQQAA
jgi:hypothetical protein